MTDPVTNALAIQLEYGEEELKQQIHDHIKNVARSVADNVTRDLASKLVIDMVDKYITDQAMSHIEQLFQQRVSVLFAQTIKDQMYVFLSDYKFQEAVRNISRQTAQQLELDALAVRTGRQFY